jgi:hypothetical protein
MNNATSTRLQRISLTLAAATVATGTVLVGSPAMATTDLSSGGGSVSRSGSTFDIADYIADRKADWAQDRVDHFWLYR